MANEVKQSAGLSKEEVTQAIQEAVKSAVAVGMAMGRQDVGTVPAKVAAPLFVGQCQACQQRLAACKGKHRQTVVYPKNPRYVDPRRPGWVGVSINGVTYRSNGPTHKVTVPEDSCPENLVAAWEDTEDTMSQGRVGGSNLGQIGQTQSFVNPFAAQQGWR